MTRNTLDIQLAIFDRNLCSHTRVTVGSSGDLTGFPDPPESRSHTRVTSGPPSKGPLVLNEGPAQPALRRFRVSKNGARMRPA
jgi:hypothetical protein